MFPPSHSRGGLEADEHKNAVHEIGDALLRELPNQPVKIMVGLGAVDGTRWAPPRRAICDAEPIVAEVSKGTINFKAEDLVLLGAKLGIPTVDNFPRAWSGPQNVWRFLVLVAERTQCQKAIFMQFVVGIGAALDCHLAGAYVQTNCNPKGAPATKEQRLATSLKQVSAWENDGRTRSSLLKYWLCGNRIFNDAAFLSLSADDSRVGGVTRMLVAGALPNNYAMFCPPQAWDISGGAEIESRGRGPGEPPEMRIDAHRNPPLPD